MIKKALLLAFIFISTTLMAQIDRIEPAYWWIGMKNSHLQLLIQGSTICNSEVIIKYPGVKVVKTNRACSPIFLFVDVEIDANRNLLYGRHVGDIADLNLSRH